MTASSERIPGAAMAATVEASPSSGRPAEETVPPVSSAPDLHVSPRNSGETRVAPADVTGLPRPRIRARDQYLNDDEQPQKPLVPAPWINGEHATEHGDFYSFRRDMARAHEERLCCICGDPLNEIVVIGAYQGDRLTSGGWGHPICLDMAVRFCPHFKDEALVAWRYEGSGVGVEDPTYEIDEVVEEAEPLDRDSLSALVKTNPWGTVASLRFVVFGWDAGAA